jgi:phage gpG-like protein
MATTSITADTKKIDKKLAKIAQGLKDFRQPLKKSADEAMKIYEGNFPKKGAEFGGWAKLSPATLKAKARMGYPLTPLIATGKMMKSFKRLELTKMRTVVGNTVGYYPYHQVGTNRLPKRVMISLNSKLEKVIVKQFTDYFKKLVNN